MFNGIVGTPCCLVAAIAHGTGRNYHGFSLVRKVRARPAGEFIAVRRRVNQHDVAILNGIAFGVGSSRFTPDEVVADGVDGGLPIGGQGDIPHRACGDENAAVLGHIQRINARDVPAQEGVARAGGDVNGKAVALDVVGERVGRIVLAAVQLVGNGVLHGLPAGVQRHRVLDNVRIEGNAVGFTAILRAEPAQEFVVVPLGIFGNSLDRQANMLQSHGVGLLLHAVVQLVGENGVLLPTGIEGHAAGEHIFRGIHRLAGEIGGEIPAEEIVANVVGQNDLQSGVAQLLGCVGEPSELIFVTGEDRFGIDDLYRFAVDLLIVPFGNVARLSLGAAKVHSYIRAPVGIQNDVVLQLLCEVVDLALTFGIVIPTRKGQTTDIGIGRPRDGGILFHFCNIIDIQITIIIQEECLIVAHALQNDLDIVRWHGEGDRVVFRGVRQPRRLGSEGQPLVAFLQAGEEGDCIACDDGRHLRRIMGGNSPIINTILVGDRQLMG